MVGGGVAQPASTAARVASSSFFMDVSMVS
jgi:hypothetical protein